MSSGPYGPIFVNPNDLFSFDVFTQLVKISAVDISSTHLLAVCKL